MSTEKVLPQDDHYIVAIGASAGGLEAINTLFDAVADFSQLSFIIIQHLSPDHKSLLVELVSKHTDMQVLEARDQLPVEMGKTYVIPNNMTMTIENGMLCLAEKKNKQIPNDAIDVFLASLAYDQGEKAIAIILSGTGSDGTKGIQHIKNENGYVIVQEPETAKFDGMPNMAILSGNVDVILPPAKIPNQLKEYIELVKGEESILNESLNEQKVNEILSLVLQHSDRDFHLYKTPTILRRIARRMEAKKLTRPDNYIQYLKKNPEEAQILADDLLVNVTCFFRDPNVFDYLGKELLPSLIKTKQAGEILKIWVCACSTGEEAYSIAIVIDQFLRNNNLHLQVKIFATDIDENNVLLASKNRFPLSIEKDVSQEILKRYFIIEDNQYTVIPRIRKQIVFAKHNVIKDPAFIKNDLITCRNMLIYMNKILQEKVLSTFHFALNPAGVLILGISETINAFEEGFEVRSAKWKIFTRSKQVLKRTFHSYQHPTLTTSLDIGNKLRKTASASIEQHLKNDFEKLLFGQLGYAVAYIDHFNEVKETLGDHRHFLTLPKRKLNLNILSMVPDELRMPLNKSIKEVRETKQHVGLKGILSDQKTINIHIQVASQPYENFLMIVFLESDLSATMGQVKVKKAKEISSEEESYVQDLEDQLNETRNNLQLAIENLETTNEELQSSNEELLSSNEELQSSNEELQSLNEELHTLNAEHQLKIKELIDLNDDLDNYFKSSEIGQIFLDSTLHIRRFNPQAMQLINLIDSDIGRPISHISNNLSDDTLLENIIAVQDSEEVYEKQIRLKDGRLNLMRIYPYIRRDKEVDGIVLTFVDISALENLNSLIKGVFDASLDAILVLSCRQIFKDGARHFDLLTQNKAGTLLLQDLNVADKQADFFAQLSKSLGPRVEKRMLETFETGRSAKMEINLRLVKGSQWFEFSVVKMKNGLALSFHNITLQKDATDRLRKNYNELIVAREQLKTLNSSLEAEVANRTEQLAASEERFRFVARATNDCIRDWDLVTNNVWHSENFHAIFNTTEKENLKQIEEWFEHIHSDDRDEVRKSLFQAINRGEEQWNGEYRFKKGEDTFCHVLDRSFILKNESSVPYRIISSLMDVSLLKEAELATRELANKKDEFMSIASHELKTPITSMKASIQLINRFAENDKGKLKTFITKANQQVDKITFLIENLLDVTKIQAGKIVLQKSTFPLDELIQDCLYEVRNMSQHKIIVSGDSQLTLYADKNRIEQVLINFLTNAIKYSPHADKVELYLKKNETEVMISIRDYGIGISEEKLKNVFDRFFRVEESSSQFSGLGLGLFISADIIKRHGGDVGAISTPGEGSTFWFKLPILKETNPTTAQSR